MSDQSGSEVETSEHRRLAERRNVPTSGGSDAGKRATTRTARVPSDKAAEAKASEITSISTLFEYAYSLQGKQVKVPQAVFKTISSAEASPQADPEASLRQLRELAGSDPLLAVPPRLLAAIEASNDSPLLRRRLTDLLIAVLARHRVFRSEKVRTVLTGDSHHVDDAFTSVALASTDATAADLGIESNGVKSSDRERLRVNAITSLALLLSARDEWTVAELVERLELHLWRHVAKKPGNRPPRVAVTESSSLDALEVVARVFMTHADKARQETSEASERASAAERYAVMARDRVEAAEKRIEQRESELTDRKSEIAALEARIRTLESDLEVERRDRMIDRSHHLDDYQTLRTRVTRTLDRQIDLLSDGLHALRNGSVSITDEYIERSVGTLKKELEQLRDDGEGY
ncbi:hypothetical protein OF855_25420 [Mycolicibacterium fortuitum]|uniref:hypothetical protein n=1 Tax=Mycolicibacterium fortuitum TaxID=1766 RepID=UPI0022BA55FA|nr:hypothetical protein [Mycolicibacterium fortuitum]WAY18571.1 hypothetical protein OF855_25420 [Mycolicibacterium fortuitum]